MSIKVRQKKRYSHAYIKLRVKFGDQWEWIKALDWNEVGFNFYLDKEIQADQLEFKRNNITFSGKLIQTMTKSDSMHLSEAILNTLLYQELEKTQDNDENKLRNILKTIRSKPGIEEKKQLLNSLNENLDKKKIDSLLMDNSDKQPLFRYEVETKTQVWTKISKEFLEATKDIIALEKHEEKLNQIVEKIAEKIKDK